jgi:GT2 family glycosyltransferase
MNQDNKIAVKTLQQKCQTTRIATILTVHNRKSKTISCLKHLFSALDVYNRELANGQKLTLSIYLTDDGCTDGTPEAIKEIFYAHNINILQGDGNLFWAGGMRLAWQAAIDTGIQWDYYLLMNDDTFIYENAFFELFKTDDYIFKMTGRYGMSSGITCLPNNKNEITYGGMNFVNKTKGRLELMIPTGEPQRIDLTHANLLLIHHSVVDIIGIFHKAYQHSCADNDYSMMARRNGIFSYTTSNICGECEHDHDTNKKEAEHLMSMSYKERKEYINSPTHSDRDYLIFVSRNMPLRYPMSLIVRTIRLYFPSIYYYITSLRGVYTSNSNNTLESNN